MAQTPSSPLIAATAAAATEGAAHASPSSIFGTQPISIIESANELAREHVEEYNAKLEVFQAFCAKFEEAAQQFTSEPHRRFAQHFADSFLDSWKRELSSAGPATPKPTYSSAAATALSTGRDRLAHRQQRQQTTTTTWTATDRSTSSPGATTGDRRPTPTRPPCLRPSRSRSSGSAAHKSNPIKQTAKQINQMCQNLISNQTNAKYRI
ncbi:hypothetical protein FOZG_16997 [Fusarium oxysporum Fo47]|uniref:Uncharacterized protein n=1 Tax=Fusarium oxysporum Fo47 TaxID=660027 RepID=W9JFZ4_FUSOX|nr:hypothetical protein FOZG_16997 [Fusarium oxysporum Fo47]